MIQGPPELRALMAELGPRWARDMAANSQRVKEAYAPLLARAPKEAAVVRDVSYAGEPRQVLDLFTPLGAKSAPVVVFVHGGAFVRGDKRTTDEMYDNVLYWFARQGFVGANLEYRLAPAAQYPAGARDVELAMEWLHANVAKHGGDPSRIFLMGHSAGGTHAAHYAFNPALREAPCRARAAVLVSARLRADQLAENPNAAAVRAYFGSDASSYEARSPVSFAGCSELPCMVVTAEFENPLLDIYGLEFAHRVALARRRSPRFMQMSGHNHMSIMAHFNTPEELLGRAILDFFETA